MIACKFRKPLGLLIVCISLLLPALALADPTQQSDAHLVWIHLAAILVLFMSVPGLAMFYSGLVQSKNAVSVISQCFIIVAISSLMWILFGYSLSFSNGGIAQPFIGGFHHLWLLDVGPRSSPDMSSTIAFIFYQMGFAVITPALITGSVAERMKFSTLVIFVILWEIIVYYPICHWVWGGGWLEHLGMLDFAGGAVVHANAGIAGLIAALVLGKRWDYMKDHLKPHNLTLVAIGTGILWIGWFGFNAGGAGNFALSGVAMLTTQAAAASTIITWLILDWIRFKKPTATSILFGAIAGLVAITPACGYVSLIGAILIGVVTGLICPWFLTLKLRLKYDDTLDVFGIHGVGGIIGALLTGLFATKLLGGAGIDTPHLGGQLLAQLLGTAAVILWSGAISFLLLKILKNTIGLRVSSEKELQGLDISDHGEEGYSL